MPSRTRYPLFRSKGEEQLFNLLRAEFPLTFIITQHPIIVKQEGSKPTTLFVDLFIPSLGLGFELQGQQHSAFSSFFHGTQRKFNHQKQLDVLKAQYFEDRKMKLISVTEQDLTVEGIRAKIAKAKD